MRELEKTLTGCGGKRTDVVSYPRRNSHLSVGNISLPTLRLSVPGVSMSPPSALRDGTYMPVFTEETEGRGGWQLVSPRDRQRQNQSPCRGGHSASQASSFLGVEKTSNKSILQLQRPTVCLNSAGHPDKATRLNEPRAEVCRSRQSSKT